MSGGHDPHDGASPRERFVTLYGRMPVVEALADERVAVDKVLLARGARGDTVDEIEALAARRGVPLQRVAPDRVTRISRNGRQDQGVVADVVAPGHQPLDAWLSTPDRSQRSSLFVLDGVTNPANVGMVIRTAVAAGIDAVVLPRAGCPEVGPLVVKASAGVALRATVLRAATAAEAVRHLAAAGFAVAGLRAADAQPLFGADLPERLAMVLGSEHDGVSDAVAAAVERWVALPMAGGVESLNVATCAAVVAYELLRRRTGP